MRGPALIAQKLSFARPFLEQFSWPSDLAKCNYVETEGSGLMETLANWWEYANVMACFLYF